MINLELVEAYSNLLFSSSFINIYHSYLSFYYYFINVTNLITEDDHNFLHYTTS